jgi:hypothetical protein
MYDRISNRHSKHFFGVLQGALLGFQKSQENLKNSSSEGFSDAIKIIIPEGEERKNIGKCKAA